MERLKYFLDSELLKAYRNMIQAETALYTIDNCFEEMNCYKYNENLSTSVQAAQILVQDAIEVAEEFFMEQN